MPESDPDSEPESEDEDEDELISDLVPKDRRPGNEAVEVEPVLEPVLEVPEPGQRQDLDLEEPASSDDSGSDVEAPETESETEKMDKIPYNTKHFKVPFEAPSEPAPALFDYENASMEEVTLGESKPVAGKDKVTFRRKVVWFASEAETGEDGKLKARTGEDGKHIRHIVAETKSWNPARKCYLYGLVGRWENGYRWTDRHLVIEFIRDLVPEENRRPLPARMGAPGKGRKRSAKNVGLEAIEANNERVRELEAALKTKHDQLEAKDREIRDIQSAKDNEIRDIQSTKDNEIRDFQAAADASIAKKKAKIADLKAKNDRLETKNERLETALFDRVNTAVRATTIDKAT